MRVEFAKGHGAMNDFIVVPALDGLPEFRAEDVRLLCDRRAGIGGDGVLRVTRGRFIEEWDGDGDVLFMDYRNADGSISEMCGNGLRVFAKYVLDEGIADGPVVQIGTRAGQREVEKLSDGRFKATMGPALVAPTETWIVVGERRLPAIAVDVGNPHAVAILKPTDSLDSLDLSEEPDFDGQVFPDGVNCEFVRATGVGRLQMRVYERGVGETMACGTGVVASVAAYVRSLSRVSGSNATSPIHVQVSVPGDLLEVELAADEAWLIGEAVIVARGLFEVDA